MVGAVGEQESAWNPWARRYEPLFFAKYVASLYTNNKVSASEAYARGFSWGLMQVMGQVARETGFDALFLSTLCDPEQGLAIGCKVLRKKFDAMAGDTTRALLAWNGGANHARQHNRDAQLLQTLAALAAEKRAITAPAQIIRELPRQIPLPVPITLQASDPTSNPQKETCSSGPVCGPEGFESTQPRTNPASNTALTQAVLPGADLKPLYDFSLDCRACQAILSATQADLTDERAKTAVLTRERDAAVRAAKGGSVPRRIARNAKWLAICAAAGATAPR